MKTSLQHFSLALAGAGTLLVAACGGGDGSNSTTATATTTFSVTVVDGAIWKATVCLDKNKNGVCDSGEPSGKTDSSGKVTLQVDPADAGKYPILAIVGTDAVDVDNGPVTVPFTLRAPADQPAVVSPLTTLVQSLIESSGATSAAAETSLKALLGVNVSLFADFTSSSTGDIQNAGTIARMVVIASQQLSAALAAAVGTKAFDGTTITQADLDRAVQHKLLEILPTLISQLSDASVTGAMTASAKTAALTALARAVIADPSTGLTATSLAMLVAVNNQVLAGATSTDAPVPSAQLRALKFTDVQDWLVRVFVSTAAQNTPDASSNTRFVDLRSQSVDGVFANWNTGATPARQSDRHWNGAAWVTCRFNGESLSSVRDALGNSTYDYCDKAETGRTNRAAFDIGGRAMIDVYNQITGAGLMNLEIASAAWLLGAATFPTGAQLFYHINTPLTEAPAYYPGYGNIARNFSPAIAAGKTSPTDTTSACASILSSTLATTLESVIAANPGTPCVFAPATITITTSTGTATVSSGTRNEWWGQSTIAIGTIGTAPVGGIQSGYYTTNTLVRIAFGSNNTVKYYACQERSSDGWARNCDPIGIGTYLIQSLGDGRLLTLDAPPLLTGSLNYQRVFVERNGAVYFGYQNKPYVVNTARLNLVATDALLTQLGLPIVDPDVPVALSPASYQGDWLMSDTANLSSGTTVRITSTAAAGCFDTATGSFTNCTVSLNPSTGEFAVTLRDSTVTGTFDFLNGTVIGTSTPTTGPAVTITGARR